MNKQLTPLQALNDLIDYLEVEHYTLSEDEGVVERKQIIEKSLKALAILKKKVIPYSLVNRTMIQRAFTEGWITIEEYDLLMEVLKWLKLLMN